MEEVDYLILGGGTAGCILANRLSASGRHRVLLVEAGGEPRSPYIRIPAGFGNLLRSARYNWGYQSEPDPDTDDRPIPLPAGRGLGGSGNINGMVYVRGQKADFDGWDASGATGWGFADVEPYFRRIEDYAQDGEARGHAGPLHVTQVLERYPVGEAFLQAAAEDGHRLVDDYNVEQGGFGYYQVNQFRGRRWSPYMAYLVPARGRSNLTVMSGTFALGLTFDGERCTGARLGRGRSEQHVRARREVILTAGSFRTPQLLELSGLGRADVLEPLGIPVRHELDAVGENYADHYSVRMNWRLREDVRSVNAYSRGWRLAASIAQWALFRRGVLTLGPALCHGFVTADPEGERPDAQLLFMHASYANPAKRILDREPGMTVGVIVQRPRSAGAVHSVSTDPTRPPAIHPRFMSAPEDRALMANTFRLVRRLVSRPAIAPLIDHEMNPGPDAQDDEALVAWARATGQTIYHPAGTCRMGSGDGAVVDPRLRVRGVEGLRVADASVMPSITSGNIHAPVMMIAERAADMILADV
jgi:choline dehydrogenase-like flavoprotein